MPPPEPYTWDTILGNLQAWFGTDNLFCWLMQQKGQSETPGLLLTDSRGRPLARTTQQRLAKLFSRLSVGDAIWGRLRITKPNTHRGDAHYHAVRIAKPAAQTAKVDIYNPDEAIGRWGDLVAQTSCHEGLFSFLAPRVNMAIHHLGYSVGDTDDTFCAIWSAYIACDRAEGTLDSLFEFVRETCSRVGDDLVGFLREQPGRLSQDTAERAVRWCTRHMSVRDFRRTMVIQRHPCRRHLRNRVQCLKTPHCAFFRWRKSCRKFCYSPR